VSSVHDQAILVPYLAQLGIGPAENPAEFDVLGREMSAWWDRGGSLRDFVEAHRRDPRVARAALNRRRWPREPAPA
jgi:hypothetical protein